MRPSLPTLVLLFAGFRLAALLLYRPGGFLGLLAVEPLLPIISTPSSPTRTVVSALILLPFDLLTLLLLARHPDGAEAGRGRWAAWLWAISPLPLVAWLASSVAPLVALLLLLLRLPRVTPRRVGWVTGAVVVAATLWGPGLWTGALLLPLLLLQTRRPATSGALFALAVLLCGPVAALLAPGGGAAALFRLAYLLALAVVLLDLHLPLSLSPPGRADRLRGPLAAAALLAMGGALFVLTPRAIAAPRLAASPLAPSIQQMRAVGDGWLLTTDYDLWQEATAHGLGGVRARVVTARNRDGLRADLLARPADLWVITPPGAPPAPDLDALLEGFYPAPASALEGGGRVLRLVSGIPGEPLSRSALFADGLRLEGARLPQRATAGALLPLELQWNTPSDPRALFVHLLDDSGGIVAQRDLPPSLPHERLALVLDARLPAGDYELVAGRYDPASGIRVPLSDGSDHLRLGTVTIGTPAGTGP